MPDGAEVVAVGRLIDEKRLDLLLDALAVLRGRGRATRATIVGDGPERAALDARARGLGLAEAVSFTGRVAEADVARHLRAARVLVLPSIREGYGMAVAEAQAAGVVPIVARGPFSAAPDLVSDGVDGLVVEPTVAALADAIDGLLGNPDRLAAMARAARETGGGRTWDAMAGQMEAAYAELLAGDGTAAPERGLLRWS
jgi:glycosyltransferase involved in cell wall biosynthesis